MIEVRYVLNTPSGAAIEYWQDDVKISEWVMEDGVIHADEKPDTYEVPFDTACKSRDETNKWVSLVDSLCTHEQVAQSKYEYTLKKKATSVAIKVKIDGVSVRDDSWSSTTNKITYAARPEVNWNWVDYKTWREIGDIFIQMILDFEKAG